MRIRKEQKAKKSKKRKSSKNAELSLTETESETENNVVLQSSDDMTGFATISETDDECPGVIIAIVSVASLSGLYAQFVQIGLIAYTHE